MASVSAETPASHGHSFSKKMFHKPTYCHSCTDMLWGLIQQGYICEVCNFVVHDRCLKAVVSPCSSIAASLIKVRQRIQTREKRLDGMLESSFVAFTCQSDI
ncbi:Diacylglycerol kinase theta [Trachymyrmex zeteki]|uniref:Diacylglycerol kinase theta n=1 Tax=Mycetomoellerius zeteki TaxID=64791 RepID=A0A151XG32_9HYME|nr:Diacylglycerol kinase theta [Trachymyrmex zeteki]